MTVSTGEPPLSSLTIAPPSASTVKSALLEEILQLTDIESVRVQLALVEQEEQAIDSLLDAHMATESLLNEPLSVLDASKPMINKLCEAACHVDQVLEQCASTAQRISLRVRELDDEQTRIKNAIKHVADIQELHECAQGISQAVTTGQLAKAGSFVSRYRSLDPAILLDEDAAVQKDKETMEKSKRTLVEKLCAEFDHAAKMKKDDVMISLWKLFPLVGEIKLGLAKSTEVIIKEVVRKTSIEGMANVGTKDGLSFADVLKKIYETIARAFASQEVQVKDIYGTGTLVYMLRMFEEEANLQTSKVLDTFMEKRNVARKIKEVEQLMIEKRSGDALNDTQKIDIRELAGILDEIAAISHQVHLFSHFIISRSTIEMAEAQKLTKNIETDPLLQSDPWLKDLFAKEYAFKYNSTTGLLKLSTISTRLREMLAQFYFPLESFFLVFSLRKALRIDAFDASQEEKYSSCVEDTFFILRQIMMRALATHDAETICVVLNTLAQNVEDEYLKQGLQNRLLTAFGGEKASQLTERTDAKHGYMVLLNNLETSALYVQRLCQEIDDEILHRFQKHATANQLEKMKACVAQLQDTGSSFKQVLKFGMDTLLTQTVRQKLKLLFVESFSQMKYVLTEDEFNDADSGAAEATPTLSTFISTSSSAAMAAFQSSSGPINALNAAGASFKQPLVRKLSNGISKILQDGHRRFLTDTNFATVIHFIVDALAKEWERAIMRLPPGQYAIHASTPPLPSTFRGFNQLGAVKFDKDLRSIVAYFNNLIPYGSIRDRMTRLTQMSLLVNLESAMEISEYYGQGTASNSEDDVNESQIQWKLSVTEIRRLLTLRFGVQEVSRIKL